MKRFYVKLQTILKSRRGNVSPLAAVLVFLVLVFFGGAYYIADGIILAQGSRDAVQNAVNNVVTSNYYTSFNGMREGNSGAYSIGGSGSWSDSVNSGNVGTAIDELLGTTANGSSHEKQKDGTVAYSINDLQIKVSNAPLSPGDNTSKFHAEATYTLYFPISLMGINIPVNIPLSVSAGFTPKF